MSHLQNITLPSHWTLPQYSLGQRTKQGTIVGIQYYPVDELVTNFDSGYWRYAVLDNSDCSEVAYLSEQKIEPLTLEELYVELQAEIEVYQRSIAIRHSQLERINRV